MMSKGSVCIVFQQDIRRKRQTRKQSDNSIRSVPISIDILQGEPGADKSLPECGADSSTINRNVGRIGISFPALLTTSNVNHRDPEASCFDNATTRVAYEHISRA